MPGYHFASEEEGREALTQAYETAPRSPPTKDSTKPDGNGFPTSSAPDGSTPVATALDHGVRCGAGPQTLSGSQSIA